MCTLRYHSTEARHWLVCFCPVVFHFLLRVRRAAAKDPICDLLLCDVLFPLSAGDAGLQENGKESSVIERKTDGLANAEKKGRQKGALVKRLSRVTVNVILIAFGPNFVISFFFFVCKKMYFGAWALITYKLIMPFPLSWVRINSTVTV